MPTDKTTLTRITSLKDAAETAGRELARHEAAAAHAEQIVSKNETALKAQGFDPTKDLAKQLEAASSEVETELAAIAVELEGLR